MIKELLIALAAAVVIVGSVFFGAYIAQDEKPVQSKPKGRPAYIYYEHEGQYLNRIYKIQIDSVEYIVAESRHGIAITPHAK